MIHAIGAGFDWLMARVAMLPTTNARILVTLAMMLATGVVYLFLAVKFALAGGTQWSPGYDWLGFLLLNAGLDITQFHSKRSTDATYVAAKRTTGEQKAVP